MMLRRKCIMRYRLRTLLIVTAFAPAIVWAATLALALLIESAGPRAYKASQQGTSRSPAIKAAKRPSGLPPNPKSGAPAQNEKSNRAVDSQDEIQRWIVAYMSANGIPAPNTVRVGMKFDEIVNVLGEPTTRYELQNGRIVKAPKGPIENWVEWHRKRQMRQMSPFIRAKIENGVATEIFANRK
jgi:hypothetical protein